MKKPIYLSKLGVNFAEWSATWAGYLITKVRKGIFLFAKIMLFARQFLNLISVSAGQGWMGEYVCRLQASFRTFLLLQQGTAPSLSSTGSQRGFTDNVKAKNQGNLPFFLTLL